MESKAPSTGRPRSTSLPRPAALAFCTCAAIGAWAPASLATPVDFAAHTEAQLRAGAVSLPLNAEVEYAHALAAIREGDFGAARQSLEASIALAPHFTDSYFTLARVEARRLSPDAIYWLVQGVVVSARSYEAQAVFAANAAITLTLVFLLASGIVWIALAIRYFPFLAHRIAELLQNRFNAAAARACAYLLLLSPFVLLPGYAVAAALVLLGVWPFMHRRERVFSFLTAATFAAIAWFAPVIDRYSTIADPTSLTSLIAHANESAADPALYALIASTPSRGLEPEQQTALGLLAMRSGEQEKAVAHFLNAIQLDPDESIAYINLGNVYYLNGQYNKALEGYRKAEQVNAADAVGQFNLAQAYIKTLLMSESSQALERASQTGFDVIRESFAERARARWSIYPRVYGAGDLWRMAATEGRHENAAVFSTAMSSATSQSPRVSFWIMVAAMVGALVGVRVIKRHRLAFQCANCGELTCDGCCGDDRGNIVCQACHAVVAGVTSDKVLEALLRQRRQSVIVRRRKSARWATMWIPGVRHVFYGRLFTGFAVACLFTGSLLSLWTRGYGLPRWSALDYDTPLWKWILPVLGVLLSYAIAVMSRQLYEVRATRSGATRQRANDGFDEDPASSSQTA
jgi:tetratricopeptide (TPR) repeat protein